MSSYNVSVQLEWSTSPTKVDPEAVELAGNPQVNASRILDIYQIPHAVSESELRDDIVRAHQHHGVPYEGVEEISVDNGGKKGKGKTWAAVGEHVYMQMKDDWLLETETREKEQSSIYTTSWHPTERLSQSRPR